jgi:hypothetical protein
MKVTGFKLGKMIPHFYPNLTQLFSIAIMTLLENRSQINQTLIYFFQSNLA